MIRRLPTFLTLSAAILCATAALAASAPAAATAPAPAAASTSPSAGEDFHRVELPGAADKKFPYTIAVPRGWTVHEIKDQPNLLWLGPDGINPESDSHAVWVRLSPAVLGKPEDVVENFKKKVPADGSWTAPVVEVREVGGVRGVWVQMTSATSGGGSRKTLILKLPLPKTSVDFMAAASGDAFDKMRPEYERILTSVRPVP